MSQCIYHLGWYICYIQMYYSDDVTVYIYTTWGGISRCINELTHTHTTHTLTLYPTWLALHRWMNIIMKALTDTRLCNRGSEVGLCRAVDKLDNSPISANRADPPAFSGDSRKGERDVRRSLS